jgi:parvulin-like peptidyl-prolyl isomerase
MPLIISIKEDRLLVMTKVLKIENNLLLENQILLLLHRYQLMPQLLQGIAIDQAITSFSCTDQERQLAIEQFEQQYQLSSPLQAWAGFQGLTPQQIEEMAIRPLLIEKFKQATWKPKVESYFINCKSRFDQVIYSLIRTPDCGLAQEIYFRIQAKEQSFSELARQYSTGVEAYTGGISGPVPPSCLIGMKELGTQAQREVLDVDGLNLVLH